MEQNIEPRNRSIHLRPTYLLDCQEHTMKERKVSSINGAGGFPGGAVVENLPANAGNTGSSPGLGRSHMPRSN